MNSSLVLLPLQVNYEFSWETALQNTGNSGIRLQYAHSRLYSLLQVNNHVKIPEDLSQLNFDLLNEPEAINLGY